MGEAIGFRQLLNTTSFKAFELEITMNHPVHIWTENDSFTQNLTSWPVPFRLVVLIEHEVLSTATRRTRSTAAWLPDNYNRLADSLWQTVDAYKFLTLVGQFNQQPSCTILLWQIDIFNQNRKFLRNFQLLVVPRHQLSSYGRRAFCVAGPSVWNSLPDSLWNRLLAGTVSENLWRCFCSQRTDAFSALEVSRRCAI